MAVSTAVQLSSRGLTLLPRHLDHVERSIFASFNNRRSGTRASFNRFSRSLIRPLICINSRSSNQRRQYQ